MEEAEGRRGGQGLVKGGAVLHKGSSADINDMISDHPCCNLYLKLEACLGEKNRSWRECQLEVAALKSCNSQVAARK